MLKTKVVSIPKEGGGHENVEADAGIAEQVRFLNDMGYTTFGSCSGMEKDNHRHGEVGWICFCEPIKKLDNVKLYLKFMGDCLLDAGFCIEFPENDESLMVNGHVYQGKSDEDIELHFNNLIKILKKNDYFHEKSVDYIDVDRFYEIKEKEPPREEKNLANPA